MKIMHPSAARYSTQQNTSCLCAICKGKKGNLETSIYNYLMWVKFWKCFKVLLWNHHLKAGLHFLQTKKMFYAFKSMFYITLFVSGQKVKTIYSSHASCQFPKCSSFLLASTISSHGHKYHETVTYLQGILPQHLMQ